MATPIQSSHPEKTNVLHLVEDLSIGGLERVLATIAVNLNREKYRVCVWCLREGGFFANKLTDTGIEVKIVHIYTARNPANIYRLYRLFKLHRFDIIHTHAYSAGTIGRICAFLTRTPVIIAHNHSTYEHHNKYHHIIERILSHITDKIICVSDMVRRFAIEIERVDSGKLLTIQNGIDEVCPVPKTTTSRLRKELDIPVNHSVICTITHMEQHKGVIYLIKSASLLLQSKKEITFLLVGKGSLKEKLRKLCVDLGINKHVIFTGERIDIPGILSLTDIFVLPSIREGLGLSILEAMSLGKPVIATNVGGIPEIVSDGITGTLVPPGDPEALYNAMNELLGNIEKQKTLGYNGKKICNESFNSQTMVSRIEELYDTLTGDKATH
ncbi:MAG: glycosyltransferase family 4 protein [Planctomycetes bacterium]|nr:glycosyltransferase family 4 protein [Planctomycetota bacterium]